MKIKCFFAFVCLSLIMLAGCQQVEEEKFIQIIPTEAIHPRPVIIDTDMAADDWMAILMVLQRTDLEVQAITVTGAGEAHCDPGVENALGLVALADHKPIPVACGQETPLEGEHVFPQSWRDGVDNMMGLSLPEGENPISTMTAVQLLSLTIQNSPSKITILTLGPLTNLGELFLSQPEITEQIAGIYIMGGAVHVPGNMAFSVKGNKVAEWNIYVDPTAAEIVFGSGAPVILVPLDATNHAKVTREFYDQLESFHMTPEAAFVYDLLSQNKFNMVTSGQYYFWDPLAAALLVDESMANYENQPVCMVTQEGNDSGQTIIGEGCPNIRIAVSADSDRFEKTFIETLNYP
ncbi:MAG: nucleoside hydrolase [Anaerolineaceae bacterium]|nr:nucleoside hydrolase [Anaerolineaceae bacterium]